MASHSAALKLPDSKSFSFIVFGFAGCNNSADDGFAVAGTPADNTTKTSADAPAENTPKTPAQTKSFTVTFNTNGGSVVEKQTVKNGEKATKPTDPTKASNEDYKYAFAGWFKDSALTNAFDFETAITTDITLYAKWNGTAIIYIGTKNHPEALGVLGISSSIIFINKNIPHFF